MVQGRVKLMKWMTPTSFPLLTKSPWKVGASTPRHMRWASRALATNRANYQAACFSRTVAAFGTACKRLQPPRSTRAAERFPMLTTSGHPQPRVTLRKAATLGPIGNYGAVNSCHGSLLCLSRPLSLVAFVQA